MKLKNPAKSHGTKSKRIESEAEHEVVPVTLPEFRLNKILVPIDFSDSSRKALHYAISFARQFGAEILLLHVVEPVLPAMPDLMGGVTPIDVEPIGVQAAKRLTEWRKYVDSSIVSKTSVRSGIPSQDIVQAAKEANTDLIVIGRRGRSGFAHLLLGGTAEYVLRHAPCPALVVREAEHDFMDTTVVGRSRQPEAVA